MPAASGARTAVSLMLMHVNRGYEPRYNMKRCRGRALQNFMCFRKFLCPWADPKAIIQEAPREAMGHTPY